MAACSCFSSVPAWVRAGSNFTFVLIHFLATLVLSILFPDFHGLDFSPQASSANLSQEAWEKPGTQASSYADLSQEAWEKPGTQASSSADLPQEAWEKPGTQASSSAGKDSPPEVLLLHAVCTAGTPLVLVEEDRRDSMFDLRGSMFDLYFPRQSSPSLLRTSRHSLVGVGGDAAAMDGSFVLSLGRWSTGGWKSGAEHPRSNTLKGTSRGPSASSAHPQTTARQSRRSSGLDFGISSLFSDNLTEGGTSTGAQGFDPAAPATAISWVKAQVHKLEDSVKQQQQQKQQQKEHVERASSIRLKKLQHSRSV